MIPAYEFENEDARNLPLNMLSMSYTFEYENDTVFFAYF